MNKPATLGLCIVAALFAAVGNEESFAQIPSVGAGTSINGAPRAAQAHREFQQAILVLLRTKDQAKARAGFLKAVSLDPAFAAPYYNLGVLDEAGNKWQQATHWFQEYLKIAPNSKLAPRVQAELVHLQTIEKEVAAPTGRVGVAYDDDIANARVFLDAGLLKEAIAEAAKALKTDPKRWEAYAIAASALSQAGQNEKAQNFLAMAIARAPGDKKSTLNKALVDARAKQQPHAPPRLPGSRMGGAAGESVVSAVLPTEGNGSQVEATLWSTIQSSANSSDFLSYLRQYPNGAFAPLAEQHLGGPQKIGDTYYNGDGVTKNYGYAMQWYQKAAAQGSAYADFRIGYMYSKGFGVTTDYAQAMQWFQKAAAQGDPKNGDFGIANLYLFGWGVQKDYGQAMQWLQKSAAQGKAEADFEIGILYRDGLGLTKDDAQATQWFQKAAAQGYGPAQEAIAKLKGTN